MSVSELRSHIGFWLRFVSNHVSHAFGRTLLNSGVTAAEWVILRQMYDQEEMSPSFLSELTGLTRGAVSKLIDRLLAKKLVTRGAGPMTAVFKAYLSALLDAGWYQSWQLLRTRTTPPFSGFSPKASVTLCSGCSKSSSRYTSFINCQFSSGAKHGHSHSAFPACRRFAAEH